MDVGRGAEGPERAGVVEGDVQPAEPPDRLLHQGLGIGRIADVAGQCGGLPAGVPDLRHEPVQFRLPPRSGHDACALLREEQGGSPADARAGARDDGDAVVEGRHAADSGALVEHAGSLRMAAQAVWPHPDP